MIAACAFALAALLALPQVPGQSPPWTPNPNATQAPPQEGPHRFPIDDPQQAQKPTKPKIDAAQVKRDADELAKLAGEIPAAVDKANRGVIPQDLSNRLKRIEKLAKQLRRELD